MAGGGFLNLLTSGGRAELTLTCNYGGPGDSEALWAADGSVTAGSIKIFNAVDGRPIDAFNDLAGGLGAQDRAFSSTGYQGTWPWHAVFTAVDGTTISRFDVTMNGSPTGDCTVVVVPYNLDSGTVVHP